MFPPWQIIRTRDGSIFYFPENLNLGHPRIDQLPLEVNSNYAAVVNYKKLLTEIALGESFVLALYLTWGRKQDEKKK